MKRLYLILLFFLIVDSAYSLEITELLPNPTGNDDAPMPAGEYIEIYNPSESQIDLEGYYFLDAQQNKLTISQNTTLDTTTIQPNSLKVIYRNTNTKFSLNNDKDTIYLYDTQSNLIDSVSYNQTKENLSVSKIDGVWTLSPPTPGTPNKITQPTQEITQEDKSCSYNINIQSSDIFYQNKINFTLSIQKVSGPTSNILLKRHIKDKEENIVKDYQDLVLLVPALKQLDYSPTLKEEGEYTIYTSATPLDCKDNKTTKYTKSFKIILEQDQEENQEINKSSSIEILEISPKNITFGETINIKFKVLKQNTQKNLVTIYLFDKNKKQITQKVSLNLFEKDYEITLELPVLLKEYCISDLYDISIQGLDTKTQKQVYIEKSKTCNQSITQVLKEGPKSRYESNLNVQNPKQEVVYQSINQKSKDYAVILFIFVLILIIIKQIKKND